MNKWNVVTTKMNTNYIKRFSNLFKLDMGKSLTMIDPRTGDRELREKEFTTWYHSNVGSLIYKEGTIGIINIYSDYHLKDNILGLFYNEYNFKFEYDQGEIDKVGIDGWLGSVIKQADDEIKLLSGKNVSDDNQMGTNKVDSGRIIYDPGAATWEDIKEYYEKKKGIKK